MRTCILSMCPIAPSDFGIIFLGFIGAVIGWLTNYFIQERFYQRSLQRGGGKATPEVRLYSSAIGGLLFAVGCFCLCVSHPR